jgi:hypothetical protein
MLAFGAVGVVVAPAVAWAGCADDGPWVRAFVDGNTVTVLRALGATLLIEVPFVALWYPRQRLRLAGVAFLANTFTNLTLNVVLPRIALLRGRHVIVGEILAVVIEALAYAATARPRDVGKALVVSAVGNALSFELGGRVARLLFG